MTIATILTMGWSPKNPEDSNQAINIHITAEQSADYSQHLCNIFYTLRQKTGAHEPVHIKSTERLFRRRVGAFGAIKKFLKTSEDVIDSTLQPFYFEINVFCYAFLKGAKNMNQILKESETSRALSDFWNELPQLQNDLSRLEEFERDGKNIPGTLSEQYLALREIVMLNSSRDERRTLATLLVSGPSTANEISLDLEMSYGLSNRILPLFEQIEIVNKYDEDEPRYALNKKSLPVVLFCLREIMGIDLLASL